jgi:hypothetical protein
MTTTRIDRLMLRAGNQRAAIGAGGLVLACKKVVAKGKGSF